MEDLNMNKKILLVSLLSIAFGAMVISCGTSSNKDATTNGTDTNTTITKGTNKFNFEAASSLNLFSRLNEDHSFKINNLKNKPAYNVADYNDTLSEETLSYLQNTILKEADSLINNNETITSTITSFVSGEEIIYLEDTFTKAIKLTFNANNNESITYTFLYKLDNSTIKKANSTLDHDDDNDEDDDKDALEDNDDDKDDIDDDDKDDSDDDDTEAGGTTSYTFSELTEAFNLASDSFYFLSNDLETNLKSITSEGFKGFTYQGVTYYNESTIYYNETLLYTVYNNYTLEDDDENEWNFTGLLKENNEYFHIKGTKEFNTNKNEYEIECNINKNNKRYSVSREIEKDESSYEFTEHDLSTNLQYSYEINFDLEENTTTVTIDYKKEYEFLVTKISNSKYHLSIGKFIIELTYVNNEVTYIDISQ